MEYSIVKRQKLVDCVKAVNALIAEGWAPLGGIAIGREDPQRSTYGTQKFYAQAMIKDPAKPLDIMLNRT